MNKYLLITANVFLLILIILAGSFFYSKLQPQGSLSGNNLATGTTPSAIIEDKQYEFLLTNTLSSLDPLKPTSRIKVTGKVKEFHLEAKETDWEIMPGVKVTAVAYNGTVPGPTIEVTEGDLVRVTLKNSLDQDTSIHWHGLHLPNKEDGVPDVTQEAIKPGESYTYEFLAGHAGTYMYHPHINSVEQIDNGLYAPFIIHPQEPELQPKFDKEYTFIFGGWNVPQANIDRNQMLNSMNSGNPHSPSPAHGEMEDMGEMDSMTGMGGMDYNFWTINGKAFPYTPEIKVSKGDRVRIRLINMSNANHPMHLHGTDFRVIAEDSHPLLQPNIINTIDVAPGKTYDIEFIADNPGNWIFHCHELHHTENDGVEPGGIISLIKYEDLPTTKAESEAKPAEHPDQPSH